jgi:hypothetical protein
MIGGFFNAAGFAELTEGDWCSGNPCMQTITAASGSERIMFLDTVI